VPLLRRRHGRGTVEVETPRQSLEDPQWLDGPDAENQIERKTSDPQLREHAQHIIRDGVTVVRGAIPPDTCDRVRDDYRRYCGEHAEAATHADEYGKHTRLGNFHIVSSNARAIGLDEGIMRVLDFLFGYRAAAYTSLTFEKSTQQKIHRDSPFFHTVPINYFAGVWTALEDIDDRAGPLEYFPGGHRVNVDPLKIGADVRADADGSDQAALISTAYGRYVEAVAQECRASGLQIVSPQMKKGDTLIWHPYLPHGGGAIIDHNLTRASIVFHCSTEHVQFFGPDVFFGFEEPKFSALTYDASGERKYVHQSNVEFYPDL